MHTPKPRWFIPTVRGRLRRAGLFALLLLGYLAYEQRGEFVEPYDPLLALLLPVLGAILGLTASVWIERRYGRFSSWGYAMIAVLIASGVMYGTYSLLDSFGVRELLKTVISFSALLVWAGAVIPLVDEPRTRP